MLIILPYQWSPSLLYIAMKPAGFYSYHKTKPLFTHLLEGNKIKTKNEDINLEQNKNKRIKRGNSRTQWLGLELNKSKLNETKINRIKSK